MSRKIPTGSTKGRRIDFEDEKKKDEILTEGKYKVRIVTKSSSASFPDVMKIVERNENYIEDELRYVIFNEINDDLRELVDLSSSWKAFRLIIEDEIIKKDEIYQVKKALFCEYKIDCEGICSQEVGSYNRMGQYSSINIYRLVDEIDKIDLEDLWSVRRLLENNRWVKKTENNKEIIYEIDLEKLIEEINEKYLYFAKYCDIYNYDKILDQLNKLRTQFVIQKEIRSDYISREEFEDYTDDEFEDSVEGGELIVLSEDQMDLLAKKIGIEMEKVLRKIMKEKK